MTLSKCCTQYVSKSGKPRNGQRTGKDWYSSQFHQTVALISHASNMLKILHARLHHYMNQELPDIQARFRKGRGTRDQVANICWIIEKAREFQKNIHLCFIDSAWHSLWLCGDHNKLWEALKDMGIPDHLTCLLRNLCVGQEATVRILYGTTDWFRTVKGVQGLSQLSPCWLKLYPEHIMRNARLDELQAGIKIGRRKNNTLRCMDDSTLMAESKEELKSLLMEAWWRRVKDPA